MGATKRNTRERERCGKVLVTFSKALAPAVPEAKHTPLLPMD